MCYLNALREPPTSSSCKIEINRINRIIRFELKFDCSSLPIAQRDRTLHNHMCVALVVVFSANIHDIAL